MKEPYHYPEERFTNEELGHVRDLAAVHSGQMGILDVNPEHYGFQGAYRMDGDNIGVDLLNGFSKDLRPISYPLLQETLDCGTASDAVEQIGELLANKHNVAVALPHREILDIGIVHAAMHVALRQKGLDFLTGILVSQTLQFMSMKFTDEQAEPTPTAEVMGYLCDYSWFSVPRSERVEQSKFVEHTPAQKINVFNQTMIRDLYDRLDEGGVLLAIAPSGTSDRVVRRGDAVVHKLAPLTAGTVKLLAHPNLWVQPVAASLPNRRDEATAHTEGMLTTEDELVFELCDVPRKISDAAGAHAVMGAIADKLDQHATDERVVYAAPKHVAR